MDELRVSEVVDAGVAEDGSALLPPGTAGRTNAEDLGGEAPDRSKHSPAAVDHLQVYVVEMEFGTWDTGTNGQTLLHETVSGAKVLRCMSGSELIKRLILSTGEFRIVFLGIHIDAGQRW